jgi:hypothetical protein
MWILLFAINKSKVRVQLIRHNNGAHAASGDPFALNRGEGGMIPCRLRPVYHPVFEGQKSECGAQRTPPEY